MQDFREIDYFGQRILQIVQPLAAGGDRSEVLALLAESVANNFAADGCWILQYLSPGVVRVAASACVGHRTHTVSDRFATCPVPPAPTPTQWRMPLLPDYQVMVVETRDRDRLLGYLVVATKGVEWYRETKLVLQMVADYVAVALIEADLRSQAQIAEVYPQLHHQLTQAIVENQPIERLFEIAVSDIIKALDLKRGLVLTLKSTNPSKLQPRSQPIVAPPAAVTTPAPVDEFSPEFSEWDRPLATDTAVHQKSIAAVAQASSTSVASETSSPPAAAIAGTKPITQVQIVTTIDMRGGAPQPLPSSFFIESSYLCQTALENAPNPTIFNEIDRQSTSIDRLIFQVDRLPSMVMIPLMGTVTPQRQPSDAVWGWLVLQHDRSRYWHPVELKLFQVQIHQIALARIQRKALKQARTAIENRTSQVQTSLQLQAKLHDVSRRHLEKLKQANEFKDEFISTIGHELRTPLTSMSLAIKMLRQVDVDPERREQYLNILEDQCQREIKLVNDLLKLQQLESKQVDVRPQHISLNQFVSEQATIVSERWQESKSLELSLHLPQVSTQIETDADCFKHIVEELLVNAGKFALPQSMVEVWVTIASTAVIFKICNLSKPIASEDLPNLFDRFRRGAGVTQQAIAGTGLGLALVKSMVDRIQGTITVASDLVESGIAKTCFTVIIPTLLDQS
jgi:signal transduction histidine kinase